MTEAFVIPHNNTVVKEGGDSTPLPENTKVLVTILPTNKEGQAIVKRPFAKEGPNSSITALAVRFRINDGQRGAGRNLFEDIPLARNLNTTANGKFPDGTPAYNFFSFFRGLGYDVDQPEGFALPADYELMGKELELVLGIEPAQGANAARNTIKFINKANGIPAQAAPAPAAAANVWKPGSAPSVAQAAPAQSAPPTGWQPPQQAPQAGPPAGSWQPAAADVEHAQAQAAAAPPLPAGVPANKGF